MDIIGSCVVDIREDDKKVYVDAELPGLTKENIEVTMENGVLIISAEKKIEEEHKNRREDLKERYFGTLYRSLTLPSNVDESKIKANMKDGVLHITIDKTEETRPRKVEIE
jgi:HSP20 family protein